MSGLAKRAEMGMGSGDPYGPSGGVEFPGAGPETGVDPYDPGGGGNAPTVDIGNDPFAGATGGFIPGGGPVGSNPFAGATGGFIPGGGPAGSNPFAGATGGFIPAYGPVGPGATGGGDPSPVFLPRGGGSGTRLARPVPLPLGGPRAGGGPAVNPYLVAHLANILAAAGGSRGRGPVQ